MNYPEHADELINAMSNVLNIKVFVEGQVDAIYEKAFKKSFSDFEECYSDGNDRLIKLDDLQEIIKEIKNEGTSVYLSKHLRE